MSKLCVHGALSRSLQEQSAIFVFTTPHRTVTAILVACGARYAARLQAMALEKLGHLDLAQRDFKSAASFLNCTGGLVFEYIL